MNIYLYFVSILLIENAEVKVSELPLMNNKRCWHSAFFIRPFVYVIGGFDGVARLKNCERIDIFKKDKFNEIANMHQDR